MYPCGCTRKEIADSLRAAHERHTTLAYPGTCRTGLHGKPARAWRLRVPDGDDAIVDCTRYITGLQLTDEVRFFIAPCIGTGTAPTAVSCRADIDVFSFNW